LQKYKDYKRLFSSVAWSCPTLCDPMNRSTPGLPVHHQLPESTQTNVHCVSDTIQPSHSLSSPSPQKSNLPRLNQEEIEIMTNTITSTEIETVIKNLPPKKKPRTGWLHRRIYQTFKEVLMPILLKLFQKITEEKGTTENEMVGWYH